MCSVHFKPDDFELRFAMGEPGGKSMPWWLHKDEFGCCVFLTIHTVGKEDVTEKLSKPEKHCLVYMACSEKHKIIESPNDEVSNRNECVNEQHAEVETVKSTMKIPH